jgi:hypothetical protein
MSQTFTHSELDDLILRKLDGTISGEGYERLIRLLDADREAGAYYVEFALLYASLSEPGKIVYNLDEESLSRVSYNTLFAELAEEERKAASLSSVRLPEPPALIEGVRERKKTLKVEREVSRFNLWFALSSIAAMLLVVLYVVKYPRAATMNVATLTDSMGAQWRQAEVRPSGTRFKNNSASHTLMSGLATIRFDYGAEVVLEGPAEFTFLSAEKIQLHYGRLFARVPTRAVGFTVDMPGGSIIDLGTEFGVVARPDGTGDVNLFSGSASLLAGEQGIRRSSRMLVPGLANRIFGDTGEVREIAFNPHEIVRRIDSTTGIIWKGQPLDLADMVGGGTGLGGGQLEAGLDPLTGRRGGYVSLDRQSDSRFVLMPRDRYIDGVFVPNGKVPQQVSSEGHLFVDCPVTGGLFYCELIHGTGKYLGDFPAGVPSGALQGQFYGTPEHPGLFIHANLGVTFDLEAIRGDYPDFGTCRFTAEAGLSTAAPRDGNADIWVLVDGQVRFHQPGVTEKGKAFPIEIELKETDRFLTLAVTDGGDQDRGVGTLRSTDSDWCVFVRPALTAGPLESENPGDLSQ